MPEKRLSFLVDHVNLAGTTRFVLGSARYHFGIMKSALDRASSGPVEAADFRDHLNRFFYHFRGFFWELVASFDTLLQTINQTLVLGIEPGEVKWNAVQRELRLHEDCSSLVNRMNGIFSSSWFREVMEFRNFAHVGSLPSEAFSIGSDPPGGPKGPQRFSGLMLPFMGEPISRCQGYGTKMDEFVRWALDEVGRIAARRSGEADEETMRDSDPAT